MFESQAYPLRTDIGRDASQHLPADTKHNTTVGRLCQWVGDGKVLFQVEKWVEKCNLLWGRDLWGTFPLFQGWGVDKC